MKKVILGLLGLTLAVASVRQWRDAACLRATLAGLDKGRVEEAAKQTQTQEEAARLREQGGSLQAEAATLREKLQRLDPAAGTPAPVRASVGENDPAQHYLAEAQRHRMVDGTYRSLGRELALAPDKLKEVYRLLYEREAQRTEIWEEPNGTMHVGTAQHGEWINEPLQNLLGAEDYRKFQEFEKTLPERAQLNKFEQEFVNRGQALQPEQYQQFLRLLADGRAVELQQRIDDLAPKIEQRTGNPAALAEGWYEEYLQQVRALQDESNRKLQAQARGFLSDGQVTTLQRLQTEELDLWMVLMKHLPSDALKK